MSIPRLKRIKVSSVQELRNWLSKQPDQEQSVMVLTCKENSRDKYVSREQAHYCPGKYFDWLCSY